MSLRADTIRRRDVDQRGLKLTEAKVFASGNVLLSYFNSQF